MALDLQALKTLHTKMQDPSNWDTSGICDHYSEIAQDFNNELTPYFQRWPDFSGNATFPVPSVTGGATPTEDYMLASAAIMWDRRHPYAAKRWELLEWLIAEVEAGR